MAIREALTRNLGWRLFSLGAAFLLWLTFATNPDLGAFVQAPLEYKGMPEHLEISSDAPASVTLDVRGTAEQLRAYSESPSAVVLDFSRIARPGEHTFQIDERNANLPQGLRLARAIPAQIRFHFEERIQREVPVEVRFGSSLPFGYTLKRYTVEPDKVMIVGPASRVQQVESAVTDSIDLSAVVGETLFRVDAYVDNTQVRLARPGRVSVRVFVERE
jgi:YbbR domain-containing protein